MRKIKKIAVSNKLELFILSFFVLILPLLYLTRTIDPVMTIRMFFLCFALLIINLIILVRLKKYQNSFTIFRHFIFYSFLLYLLISTLSLVTAINLPEAFYDLTKVLLYFFVFIFVSLILNFRLQNISIICKCIVISSLIIACIGLIQYFFNKLYFIPGAYEVYSTFTNRNLFASILFLCLPFVFWSYYSLPRFWFLASSIAIFFSYYVFAIVKTRSVWLANLFSFAIVLFILFVIRKSKNLRKAFLSRKTVMLFLLIVVAVGTVFILPPPQKIRDSSVGRKDITSAGTLDIRLKAWEKTIPMIKEHPWLGVGTGNWKIMLPKYGVSGMKTGNGRYQYLRPHNDFLWVWAELGIIGFLSYAAFFVILIIYSLRIICSDSEFKDKILTLFLLFGVCGYIVISSFSFPKERIYHSVILMIIASIITVIYHRHYPVTKKRISLLKMPTLIISLFLLTVLLLYCYHRLKSEVHLYFSMQARTKMDHRVQITALSEINTRIYNMSPNGVPIHWFRGIAFYELNQIDLAFADFSIAYKNHPHHIYILNNLASCYEIMGNHEKAIEFYNKVLEISPQFEESIVNLSAVYYNMQEYDKAFETISRCSENSEDRRYKVYKEKIEEKFYQTYSN